MSPMSDQPITLAILAKFHREVIVPDVHSTFETLLKPRFDEINGRFDAVFHKLDKLETEYESLKAGLKRVEGSLGVVEARLDGMDKRLNALQVQYADLLAGVHRLEERLARVEKNVDEIVADKEKERLRSEVADLRVRVDVLQLQVRNLEKRFEQ